MNEAVTGRCVRMSWSALSDSGMCSVRSDSVCGRVGARSMTDTTCVIPSLVSCSSSRAMKRSVRYNRGSTSLATCMSPRSLKAVVSSTDLLCGGNEGCSTVRVGSKGWKRASYEERDKDTWGGGTTARKLHPNSAKRGFSIPVACNFGGRYRNWS